MEAETQSSLAAQDVSCVTDGAAEFVWHDDKRVKNDSLVMNFARV